MHFFYGIADFMFAHPVQFIIFALFGVFAVVIFLNWLMGHWLMARHEKINQKYWGIATVIFLLALGIFILGTAAASWIRIYTNITSSVFNWERCILYFCGLMVCWIIDGAAKRSENVTGKFGSFLIRSITVCVEVTCWFALLTLLGRG